MSQNEKELLDTFVMRCYLEAFELNPLIYEATLLNETLKYAYSNHSSKIGVTRKLLREYEEQLLFVIGKKYFNSVKKN